MPTPAPRDAGWYFDAEMRGGVHPITQAERQRHVTLAIKLASTATIMLAYDPDHAPDPAQWLAIDEQERIVLVEAFHLSANVELPSLTAHAAFHAMVENQIALQLPSVVRAMARLAKQGLSRHDVVHAVSWVLAQHFHEIMTTRTPDPTAAIQARYDAAVERLTAAGWRAQVEE